MKKDLSLIGKFKKRLTRLLGRSLIKNGELIRLAERLEYPDLINLICNKENTPHFSDVCVEYLDSTVHQEKCLNLSIRHVISKYVNKDTCEEYQDSLNIINGKLCFDSKLVHELDIRNVVKRDNEYRKVIKHYLPEISSIDCNFLISSLILMNQVENSNETD